MEYILSTLPKTWVIDLDGTLVKHNGYLHNNEKLLEGTNPFFSNVSENDYVIILTARKECYREQTEKFLHENGIRYNAILFDIPMGERVLINDEKPSGLKMAYAVNLQRDMGIKDTFIFDEEL